MNLKVFRRRLRAKMAERKVSQASLAREVKVHRTTIARWLHSTKPETDQLLDLGTALQTSVRWLMGRSDDDQPAMYPPADERALLRLYRALDANGRALAVNGLEDMVEAMKARA